ncbi:MAG: metal-sensitive transcriptional regulator [Leptospiraceae bacterium]|nr:metal-sensitive transcriptional regulator [Leptospiraceae bacterium]MCK6381500.1 metal-sensitive transcriptional regulator [Leptospiraceae bacterium]NUM42739.1 metal-sensitive transcriptional regulator [Leptospiraceae bacterium]
MDEKKALINRLSRIEGQIAAIKRDLMTEKKDCEKTLHLLKAANHAMKKFGEAYISHHIDVCIRSGSNKKEVENDIRKAITAAFSF